MLLELFSERSTVDGAMTHPIMECLVVTRSGAHREWFRVPHPKLVLNSAKDGVVGILNGVKLESTP